MCDSIPDAFHPTHRCTRAEPPLASASTSVEPGHGDVAGEGGQQGAVGPAEAEGFFGRSPGEQAVDQAGGEAVAAADAVDDVELAWSG